MIEPYDSTYVILVCPSQCICIHVCFDSMVNIRCSRCHPHVMNPFIFHSWLLCVALVSLAQSLIIDSGGSRCQTSLHQGVLPEILYESERILAICKPSGISHHDDNEEGSGIMSLIRKHQASGEIGYHGRIYGVHRLDRVTSGVLLFAKDPHTAGILSAKFREGEITKCYCGISTKKPTVKKQGLVKGNMIQGRRKSWLLTRDSEANSDNYAKTRFFTTGLTSIATHLINAEIQPKTLILFLPFTGRTHQVRVAAKSVGLPLLGDPVYKDGNSNCVEAPRTYLHASALHFELDEDETVTIWSQPPFGSLWDFAGSEQFDQRVRDNVRKHCGCDALVDLLS